MCVLSKTREIMKWDCVTDKLSQNYGRAYLSQNNVSSSGQERPNSVSNNTTVDRRGKSNSQISFGVGNGNLSKYTKLYLRQLSHYMKEPSEMINAEIQAIGTGIIAPIAIMCSEIKKNALSPKEEQNKKKFQALRQPVSALLAFGFQIPTTIGIAKTINYLAYEKQIDFFKDEVLRGLIPDKKYLRKQALKLLKNPKNQKLKKEWRDELKLVQDFESLKPALIEKIRRDYDEVGIKISPEELEKMAKDAVSQHTAGKNIAKVIVVPGRMVSVVAK